MPGYCPASICCFSPSPFGPPAISTKVGTQSREANISFLTVPGLMTPGQRITIGARMPPSQVLSLPPLNGVTPPSGKVIVSAPLSVVKTTIVLLVWPMSSIFLSTTPMLSSICFMPASLTPQSLPPGSPTIARYLSASTVVERSSVSGPWSWHVWFAGAPSDDLHHNTLRGGVRQTVVLGSTAPGTSGMPGIGVFLHGGAMLCWVGVLLMSGKLTPCIASR